MKGAVTRAFQEEWARVVATLIRATGDWDLAEEAAQDAFARAVTAWARDGVPDRPGAWLTTAARHAAVDRLRRRQTGARKQEELEALAVGRAGPGAGPGDGDDTDDPIGVADDRLRLMFTCCHPALGTEAQVALTLRVVAGLTTAEIARAFLVPEATMAQRLVRAKHKIRHAAIPYRVPAGHHLPERTRAVLAVVYLLFNEGYSAGSGEALIRVGLTSEALRLGQLLRELMPDEPEVTGLLALMVLHDARRAARTDEAGDIVLLEDQDRSRWDRAAISEGLALLDAALRLGRPGPYQVQAAISACHVGAPTAEETDWAQISALYFQLAGMAPSPLVELNRAVAVAMVEGPEVGLAHLARVEAAGGLDGYHLLPAARADLLRRAGRPQEAAPAYARALELVRSEPERRYLQRRLQECVTGAPPAVGATP